MESQEEYFTIEFYSVLVYSNGLFDVAKLLDIAAIYGSSNPKAVNGLIQNVFEFIPQIQNDFKEAFDMMINIFKRIFKDALRCDQMIKGDSILQKSRGEQDEIILRLLQNMIEMLTNF